MIASLFTFYNHIYQKAYFLLIGDLLTILAQFVIVFILAISCEHFTGSIRHVINMLEKMKIDSEENMVDIKFLWPCTS